MAVGQPPIFISTLRSVVVICAPHELQVARSIWNWKAVLLYGIDGPSGGASGGETQTTSHRTDGRCVPTRTPAATLTASSSASAEAINSQLPELSRCGYENENSRLVAVRNVWVHRRPAGSSSGRPQWPQYRVALAT